MTMLAAPQASEISAPAVSWILPGASSVASAPSKAMLH
jgi:hypothetical protein